MQFALLTRLHNLHIPFRARYFTQRIFMGVIHGGGGGHWAWVERLYLVGSKVITLKPQGQIHHIFIGRAWVSCDKVGN